MTRRNGLQLAAFALFSFFAAGVSAQVAGKDYNELSPPQRVAGLGVEVVEFFSFGCPHCMNLEPLLQKWRARQPKDVQFRRVPVSFGRPEWAALARMYLALQSIGMGEKLTIPAFTAIHAGRINLADEKTRDDWLARQGVDMKKYHDSNRSFGIDSLVKRAEQYANDYKVASVPSIYVDGRYEVQATSYEELLANTDLLIAKARKK